MHFGKVFEELGGLLRREKLAKFFPGLEIKLGDNTPLIISRGGVDDGLGGFEVAGLDGFGQPLVPRQFFFDL